MVTFTPGSSVRLQIGVTVRTVRQFERIIRGGAPQGTDRDLRVVRVQGEDADLGRAKRARCFHAANEAGQ